MRRPRWLNVGRVGLCLCALWVLAGCSGEPSPSDAARPLVFKHSKLFGDPTALAELIRAFEARHPGVRVRTEALPSASDEQHQFYVINLRGGSADFDVLALDVIWVAEFARAGWIADLTEALPEVERKDFFPGPLAAVTYRDRLYAIPWFIDAGLLYYRKDLLAKHGFAVPRTWDELARTAHAIAQRERGVYGFVWQGKQYEGLVCNVLEYLWSAGGQVLQDGSVVLDSAANRQALSFVRRLMREGVSPELVTTATEEPSRHIFGSGRAVFLRNWPYAWTLFQQPDSPVAGKVGMTALPHFPGHAPAATLGGWQLGVNAHSRRQAEAAAFVRFMTSAEALRRLAQRYGLNPARRALYRDPALLAAQPHLEQLRDIFEQARPRPVTSQYIRLSQVLQSEFSAVVAGIRSPAEALGRAQRQAEAVFGEP